EIGHADRAAAGHQRVDPGIQHAKQHVEGGGMDPRAASSHSIEAGQHDGAHNVRGIFRADTNCVADHDVSLKAACFARFDAQVPQGAEASVQAVDSQIGRAHV